tara:strand:+ start:180 stop:404 length:225 start_codon:yes stop_codon:yes gene_type:complete
MVKFVLLMWLCSSVPGNECKVVPTPTILFDDHYECSLYGYKYSHTLFSNFDREFVNEHSVYAKFTCTPKKVSDV